MTAAHIGLSEDQFWQNLPRQTDRVARAHNAATRRQDERTAWIVATVMNFAGKQLKKNQSVTIDDLMGGADDPETEGVAPAVAAGVGKLLAHAKAREAALPEAVNAYQEKIQQAAQQRREAERRRKQEAQATAEPPPDRAPAPAAEPTATGGAR